MKLAQVKPAVTKRLVGLKERLFFLEEENMKYLGYGPAPFDLKEVFSFLAQEDGEGSGQ